MILLAAGIAIGGLLWVTILGPGWIRRTSAAGGHWSLAGIIYLSGPINALIQLTYPDGQDPAGLGLVLARGNTVLAWALAVVALLTSARAPRRGQVLLTLGLLSFYASLLVSTRLGYAPDGVPESYLITPLLVLPFVLHGGYRSDWLARVLRRALRMLIVLSLAAAIALPTIGYDQDCCREIFGIERVQGIVGHPNTLAILAVFAVILEIRGGRLIWLVPELVALVLAQSTTGWVALALGVLVLAGRLGSSARVIAIVVVVGSVWFAATDPSLVTDFFPPEFFTFTGRTTIWQAALHGFFLNPVFGYGPDLLDDQYRAKYLGVFDAAGQAHNQFIQSAGETGLVGLACLAFLLFAVVRSGLRASKSTQGLSIALVLAFFARLMSETPLRPQGSTATLLIPIAVLGLIAAGSTARSRTGPVPEIDRSAGTEPIDDPLPPAALDGAMHSDDGLRAGASRGRHARVGPPL